MPLGVDAFDAARLQGQLWQPSTLECGFSQADVFDRSYRDGGGRVHGLYAMPPANYLSPAANSIRMVADGTYGFCEIGIRFLGCNTSVSYDYAVTYFCFGFGLAYLRLTSNSNLLTSSGYENGDLSGSGSVSTTTTPQAETSYVVLINDTNTDYVDFSTVRFCLASASSATKLKVEGHLAWLTGSQRGLSATHPFRNRPPLIGD